VPHAIDATPTRANIDRAMDPKTDRGRGRAAAASPATLRGWLRLARCPGLTTRRAIELVALVGEAAAFAGPDEAALLRAGLPIGTLARLRSRAVEKRLSEERRVALARGFTLLCIDDPRYPEGLRALAVPPPVLTVAGDAAALSLPSVAVVGSRSATAYGLAHAARIAGPLARRGLSIVSGLARGIDAAAHRAALDEGGVTVAVLGTGADRVYPSEHRALAERIEATGALVSEFPAGLPPKPGQFPRRNRLIAGLALAVVVIEAAARSGSLSTARWAAEEGRAVLAAPGRAGEKTAAGTLSLLRDGAALACSPDDVLAELPPGMRGTDGEEPGGPGRPVSAAAAALERLTPDSRLAFDAVPLHAEPHVDELIDRLGMPCERVLAALFELELAGLFVRAPGGRLRRSPGAVDLHENDRG
jgi:DNA processing protein